MIHLILQGGLGNQMFEYATAYALARHKNTSLVLDMSFFDAYGHKEWCRPYELSVFNLHENAQFEHNHSLSVRILPKIARICRQHEWKRFGSLVFTMRDLGDAGTSSSNLLYGYFANYHTFSPYRDDLLKQFTFAKPLEENNKQIFLQMQSTNSVAVHIRRGDYLNSVNRNTFYIPSVDWYKSAIMKIKEHVPSPVFYFFSDDLQWVQEQFSDMRDVVFVEGNKGSNSYRDMQLMAACKHAIIANSTFSWWGAWLNSNKQKVIIAPSKYYLDEQANSRYRQSMLLPEWIQL